MENEREHEAGLAERLLELVSPDIKTSRQANDAIMATYPVAPRDEGIPTHDPETTRWREAIGNAILSPGFPRHAFLSDLTNAILSDQPDAAPAWQQSTTWYGTGIRRVFQAAGLAWLDALDSLWKGLESESCQHLAVNAIHHIGQPAAAEFLDYLLDQFEAGNPNVGPEVIADVGGPASVDRMVSIIEQCGAARTAFNAARVLEHLGADICDDPDIRMRISQWASSQNATRRCVAACLLRITRNPDTAVAALLKLTRDDSNQVQGYAIESLGSLAASPDKVMPRLLELIDSYEEFDCDEAYGGAYSRLHRAFAGFGEQAAPAMPHLIEYLEAEIKENEDDLGEGLHEVLRAIGAGAREALPILQRVVRSETSGSQDELRQTINAIRHGQPK